MNSTSMLVSLFAIAFPLVVAAQESKQAVRRELFDPHLRNKDVNPSHKSVVEPRTSDRGWCGTGSRNVDPAANAQAVASAEEFRSTGIRAYAEADSTQVDEGSGIKLLIEFANEGDETFHLNDISNSLNITLFRKTPPFVGHVIPSWSPHRIGRPKYSTEFPDEAEFRAEAKAARMEIEKRRPYHVGEPSRRSANVRTLRDIRETDDVTLNPGDRFQMIVRITEGVADPAEYWRNLAELSKESSGSFLPAPAPSDIGPLTAGEYSLSFWVSVSLSVPTLDETPVKRHYALLICDAIDVLLGQLHQAEGD